MKHCLIFAACAVFALAGCQNVNVAQRELGPDELEWKEFVNESYPAWQPNETVPPGMATDKKAGTAAGETEVIFGEELEEGPVVSGNAATPGSTAQPTEQKYTEYTVEKGDSLSIIAKKVYGDGRKYYRIYKANASVIADPNKIYPGTKLRIPAL